MKFKETNRLHIPCKSELLYYDITLLLFELNILRVDHYSTSSHLPYGLKNNDKEIEIKVKHQVNLYTNKACKEN